MEHDSHFISMFSIFLQNVYKRAHCLYPLKAHFHGFSMVWRAATLLCGFFVLFGRKAWKSRVLHEKRADEAWPLLRDTEMFSPSIPVFLADGKAGVSACLWAPELDGLCRLQLCSLWLPASSVFSDQAKSNPANGRPDPKSTFTLNSAIVWRAVCKEYWFNS